MQLEHHDALQVQVYARRYRVTALFTEVKAANRHMEAHRDEGVIAEQGGIIVLAKLSDEGIPVARA